MYKNLREYLTKLEKEGELIRIKEPVSTNLEIAEITDRVSSSSDGGKALLFENTGTKFPVVTNMLGSDKRIAMALGVKDVDEFTNKIDKLIGSAMSPKNSIADKLLMLPLLSNASKWMPTKLSSRGECQQVVIKKDKINLSELPILKCGPHDAAPFITLPLVHTIDPFTGTRNIGMYRMQVMGVRRTGMHWHTHKTGERHYRGYKEMGSIMPVSVVLGGDPAYTYSATAPLPDGIDEYMLSGFIRNKSVKLVKCLTNDNWVPSDADIVIEGYIDPKEDKVLEGPFADHTGFYSLEDYYPIFHVTCITHRKDAIYPATLVGIPPKEDCYIGKATERIFLSPIKAVMQPEIKDMWLPTVGVSHNFAFVDIKKTYLGQATKVGLSLLGAGQMMFTKCIIITEGLKGKLSDPESLIEILKRIDIDRDVTITNGVMDVLDHASSIMGFGGKMVIDATNLATDSYPSLPETLELVYGISNINCSLVDYDLPVLIISLPHSTIDFATTIKYFITKNDIRGIKLIIAVDENVDIYDYSTLMWLVGGNVDVKRDSSIFRNTLIIDARAKYNGLNDYPRQWPNVIVMSNEIIEHVDSRWEKYGIGKFIASPSEKYRPLLFSGKATVRVR